MHLARHTNTPSSEPRDLLRRKGKRPELATVGNEERKCSRLTGPLKIEARGSPLVLTVPPLCRRVIDSGWGKPLHFWTLTFSAGPTVHSVGPTVVHSVESIETGFPKGV